MTISRPRTEAPRRRPPTPRLGRSGTRGARAAFLGTGPTAWYDARDLLATSQQTLTSRVGTGSAQLGSTGTSDTNDPLVLPRVDGESYFFASGNVVGNYASIPDAPNLDMSGDFQIVLRVFDPAWGSTPSGTTSTYVARYDGPTGATRAWDVRRSGSSNLNFLFVNAGGQTSAVFSTAGFPSAGWVWLKIDVDVDNGAGQASFTASWAADQSSEPTSWTTIGTVNSTLGAGAHNASSFPIVFGTDSPGTRGMNCGIKRFILRDTSSGSTTVVDVNPTTEALGQASWTCTTGQTITVNRATSGLTTAVVTRPLLMADGTDDYVQLPAGDTPTFTATTGAYTVMLINRVHNLAGAATLSRVWSSESASAVGAHIYLDNASAQYKALVGGASTVATAAAAFTQTTQLHAVAAVFDTGTVKAYTTTTGLTAGADTTGVGTVTHTTPRVGSRADSVANAADLETYAVVHWTRALTATELATAATYLLGTYS